MECIYCKAETFKEDDNVCRSCKDRTWQSPAQMNALMILKNHNGYLPSTDVRDLQELKPFDLKWKNKDGIELEKTIMMTQENWNYMTKYLRLDTDEKILAFLKSCEENGRANAIQDQQNHLLVNEVAGETSIILKLDQLGYSPEEINEKMGLLEQNAGGVDQLLLEGPEALIEKVIEIDPAIPEKFKAFLEENLKEGKTLEDFHLKN